MPDDQSVVAVLKVTDLQKAVDFYSSILGFSVAWRAAAANYGRGENVTLVGGATKFLLSTGAHLGDKPQFTGTLYFQMTRVRESFESIKDGVEMVWPFETMEYSQFEFGIRDPDGYILAFAEPAAGDV